MYGQFEHDGIIFNVGEEDEIYTGWIKDIPSITAQGNTIADLCHNLSLAYADYHKTLRNSLCIFGYR
jgi:predicted RNase H-like HicB family nuclease